MALDYNCPICNRALGYEGLCWKCKADKERDEALNLSEKQIEERQMYLIEHIQELGRRDDPAEKFFWECLSYHGVISQDLQRTAVKARAFYPVEMYYRAPEDVRDELIKNLMHTKDSIEASHLLRCLAMQGDSKSLYTFYMMKKNPLNWRKDLYVDTDVYAQEGGWTFDALGRRKKINYDKCYSIEKNNTGDVAVVIGKKRTDNCPHCRGKLVDILSVDGTDKRLDFLEIPGKITATCCPNCICFTEFGFSRFQLDGSSEACFPYVGLTNNEENYMSEENYEELENNGFELSKKEKPLFYGANDWEAVTLGGFAHWIQDCKISMCPKCGNSMRYLAQLSWESIMNDLYEGTLYIEVCPDCKVVSMHHQQT